MVYLICEIYKNLLYHLNRIQKCLDIKIRTINAVGHTNRIFLFATDAAFDAADFGSFSLKNMK